VEPCVKHLVDLKIVEDIRRYRLHYTCESCAYYEPDSASCSEGYPNHEHVERPLHPGSELCFCKLFELA
jgi:hypothetical protein